MRLDDSEAKSGSGTSPEGTEGVKALSSKADNSVELLNTVLDKFNEAVANAAIIVPGEAEWTERYESIRSQTVDAIQDISHLIHHRVSDMKPSDQDADTKDTLSRPGGGSQDSIDLDKILHRMAQHYQAVALERTPPNKTDIAKAKSDILAWHNTQLKQHTAAVANEARKDEQSHKLDFYYLPNKSKDFHAGFNEAIDQLVKYRELRIAGLSAKEKK